MCQPSTSVEKLPSSLVFGFSEKKTPLCLKGQLAAGARPIYNSGSALPSYVSSGKLLSLSGPILLKQEGSAYLTGLFVVRIR